MKRLLVSLFLVGSLFFAGSSQTVRRRPIVVSASSPCTLTNATPLDNFNRTEDPLANGTWTTSIQAALDGALKTNGTVALPSSGGTSGVSAAYWSASTFGANTEVYGTISNNGGSSFYELWPKAFSPGTTSLNGYAVRYQGSLGGFRVFKWDNSSTVAQLGSNLIQGLSDGDSFGAVIISDVMTICYKPSAGAWTALSPTFDVSAHSGSGANIGMGLVIGRLDNFGGGTH